MVVMILLYSYRCLVTYMYRVYNIYRLIRMNEFNCAFIRIHIAMYNVYIIVLVYHLMICSYVVTS